MVAWNPNRLWNPWSSEFLGCRWEPQKIKPQSLMVNDVNTQPFLVILGCFLMEFTGTKNNSRPLPVRQCADSVFRVFCAKPQGLRHEGFWSSVIPPPLGLKLGVLFFCGMDSIWAGCRFSGFHTWLRILRCFQKLLTSSQRRQISAEGGGVLTGPRIEQRCPSWLGRAVVASMSTTPPWTVH